MKQGRLWSTFSFIKNYVTSRDTCPVIVLRQNKNKFLWTRALWSIYHIHSWMNCWMREFFSYEQWFKNNFHTSNDSAMIQKFTKCWLNRRYLLPISVPISAFSLWRRLSLNICNFDSPYSESFISKAIFSICCSTTKMFPSLKFSTSWCFIGFVSWFIW